VSLSSYTTHEFPLSCLNLGKDLAYTPEFFTPQMVRISIDNALQEIDRKIAKVRVAVPSIELAKPVIVKVPRDWREAIKARFAPRWLLKRWPVKLLEIRVQTDAILKNFAMLPKQYNPEVIVLVAPEETRCF
jgi:hypothetical protein